MNLEQTIFDTLEQARQEILANMAAQHENASGRTSRGFRTEAYTGGIRLVLAHDEFATIQCEPNPPKDLKSVQVGVAPLETLEIGYDSKSGVPRGFYYIIKQWTRDKGIQFGKESERQTFAYFVAQHIAEHGTKRSREHVKIYDIPAKKAEYKIRTDIRAAIAAQIHAVQSNF